VLAIYDVLGKICDILLHSERRRQKNINTEYITLLLKEKPFCSTMPKYILASNLVFVTLNLK
jgi:hypothetical protein